MLYRKLGGTDVDSGASDHVDLELSLTTGEYSPIVVIAEPLAESASLNISLAESDYYKQVVGEDRPQPEDTLDFDLTLPEGDYFLQVEETVPVEDNVQMNVDLDGGVYETIVLDTGEGRYDDLNFKMNITLEGGSYDE